MQKTILITGCSSGIGLQAAHQLHMRGYRVIASVRNPEHRSRVLALGIPYVLTLDLADSASINAAVAETLHICQGELFALFNNGAFAVPGAVEDLSREALRCQFETNVFGTHELTQKLLPTLLQQPDARIVQNSSVLGFAAMPLRGAYVASKFALEGLTDCLRMELRGTSVKVVLIEPGPIETQFRHNALQNFKRFITVKASRHQVAYQTTLDRLSKEGPAMKFTLPPQAVVAKLIMALETPKPKARYGVTLPTHIMALGKRFLSSGMMDRLLGRFA